MTNNTKPVCITLVGMPGCGKSTWVDGFRQTNGLVDVVSFDECLNYLLRNLNRGYDDWDETPHRSIEQRIRANIEDMAYAEVFDRFKDLADIRIHAISIGLTLGARRIIRYGSIIGGDDGPIPNTNVIVDATNLSVSKRRHIQATFSPEVYDHHAVFFPCTSLNDVLNANIERQNIRRNLPVDVLEGMYRIYEREASNMYENESHLYKSIMIPKFQNRLEFGRIYD